MPLSAQANYGLSKNISYLHLSKNVKTLAVSSKYFDFFKPERYQQKFLKDKNILKAIFTDGYAVLPLLSPEEIHQLRKGYEELKTLVGNDLGEDFWPSGRHADPKVRNFAKSKIDEVIPKHLNKLFIEDSYRLIGGTYLLKPPSAKSALNPHQDSAHVNEFTHFSTYLWIPLEDVTEESGGIRVLPKSHQFNIKQRSLNVPWALEPFIHILDEYMVNVHIRAGEVLIFDAALIHSSPPNFTEKDRVAINYYVHPSQSPFCHYYKDEHTPEGEIEVFDVTPEFYYTEDFEQKPSKKYQQLENQPQLISHITEKELRTALNHLRGHSSKNLLQ